MDYFKGKLELLYKIKDSRNKETKNENKISQENYYHKCKSCNKLIAFDQLKENQNVCPHCSFHNKIGVIERANLLFDTYELINFEKNYPNPLDFEGYDSKRNEAVEKTGLDEAVIVVKAKIENIKFYSFLMDSDFLMASMGLVVGERIALCFDMANDENLPVIGFCASGGARMQEGIFSLMQMANTTFSLREHSENNNLYIAVLTDPTTGGVSASFANLADIIIAEPKSRIGFTGKRVIEDTTKEKLPKDFQSSEFVLKHGFLDDIVDRRDMKAYLLKLLQYHRSSYDK